MMKSQRSAYTTLDFHGWHENGNLILSPKFQRRTVWSASAKSYLIDSILKEMPVPPIYLRVRQSDDKSKTVREVVDGQQRIGSVVSFLNDGFTLTSNSSYVGKKFSQLPKAAREIVRSYSFNCEVLQGVDDAEVLQIFRRLNMYSVPLNAQELRNGNFFGLFKESAYRLAEEHLEFWRRHRVFSEQRIARMGEVEFTSELMVLLLDGLQDKKKSLDVFYDLYDSSFAQRGAVEKSFRHVMDIINEVFPEGLREYRFHRVPLLYTLFGAVAHRIYGLPGLALPKGATKKFTEADKAGIREAAIKLAAILEVDNEEELSKSDFDFVTAASSQTDNIGPRKARLKRLVKEAF